MASDCVISDHCFSITFVNVICRKQKVLSQLQPNLLSLFFDCITVSPPFKSDLSSKVADEDDGYLDFTVSR